MIDYAVYILQCSDGSFYTGITNNVEVRYWQHQTGINSTCYTYDRRPVDLVYTSYFRDVWQAIAWEKQIKKWSRKKKIALIEGNYEALPELSSRITKDIAMVRPFDKLMAGSLTMTMLQKSSLSSSSHVPLHFQKYLQALCR